MKGERTGSSSDGVEEALFTFAVHGWANTSFGSAEEPQGWTGRISIDGDELPEMLEAFEEELAEIDVKPAELLGHWLLRERIESRSIEEYDTYRELQLAFRDLHRQYIDEVERGGEA